MPQFAADSRLVATLWDFDHESHTRVRNFFNEEVAYGRALLVATDSIQREVLDILAATLQTYPPVPDILLKLHEDIVRCIRLQRPDAARKAVRKLLGNTDLVIDRLAK